MISIITHDGLFHGDEVMAVAMIKFHLGSDIDVVRTRDIQTITDGLNDVDTFVIDVGGIYDPSRKAFDHHQDRNLDSSVKLVADYLFGTIYPEWLEFISSIVEGINYQDLNGPEKSRFSFSTYITSFNHSTDVYSQQNDDCFMEAVEVCFNLLNKEKVAFGYFMNSVHRVHEAMINSKGQVIVLESFERALLTTVGKSKRPLKRAIWRESEGCFVVRDLTELEEPILKHDDSDIIFVHNGGFMGKTRSFESALRLANLDLLGETANCENVSTV